MITTPAHVVMTIEHNTDTFNSANYEPRDILTFTDSTASDYYSAVSGQTHSDSALGLLYRKIMHAYARRRRWLYGHAADSPAVLPAAAAAAAAAALNFAAPASSAHRGTGQACLAS